jgi:hypothetical protein
MTEEPLNFEREPEEKIAEAQEPLLRDLHMSVTRNAWRTHGMMHLVKDAAHAALDAVTRLSQRMHAMPAEGPPDYPVDFHERLDRVERQIERERYAPRSINNGGNDEFGWKTVALWALGALQAGTLFVLGLAWNSMDKMQVSQAQTHDDVIQIKCKLDPQCRIVVTNARP